MSFLFRSRDHYICPTKFLMKHLLIVALITFSPTLFGQYYYKDIIGTKETNDLIKRYADHKVRSVLLTSYEDDGSITEDFLVQQQVSRNPISLRTITRTSGGDETILVSYFDSQLRLNKTVDSSGNVAITTTYNYDAQGNVSTIKSVTMDSTNTILMQEEHIWTYDNAGKIVKMQRRKNLVPMDEIVMTYDDNGNIVEERTMKNGKLISTVYYYYNDKNLMTDVVRFNERAQRLLPDYMFEYSPSGQVIQKITVPANSSDYLIWRYQFDERGIKTKEALYDKYKKLVARIDYQYSYY